MNDMIKEFIDKTAKNFETYCDVTLSDTGKKVFIGFIEKFTISEVMIACREIFSKGRAEGGAPQNAVTLFIKMQDILNFRKRIWDDLFTQIEPEEKSGEGN